MTHSPRLTKALVAWTRVPLNPCLSRSSNGVIEYEAAGHEIAPLMASPDITRPAGRTDGVRTGIARTSSTETKHSSKTTEFYAYVAAVVGTLLAGLLTRAGDGHDDRLGAGHVWLYVAILTVGYMLSRGLAKSGSRDPYRDDDRS